MLDSELVQAQRLHVRCATGRQKQPRDPDLPRADRGHDLVSVGPHARHGRREHDLDAVVLLERGVQRRGGLLVGARRDAVGALDDRHARAEPREDLRELEPDGPAANDEQRLRELGQLERGDVVDPVDVVDALDRRHRGPRAGRDQDSVGAQLLITDTDGVRREQLGLALIGVEPRVLEVRHPLRVALLERVLPRLDPSEVETRGADIDSELAGEVVHVVEELGDDEVRLRRLAGHVRAAAAPARALDERDARVALLDGLRRRIAGSRAGAEDDQVVTVHSSASLEGYWSLTQGVSTCRKAERKNHVPAASVQ